MSYLRQSVFTGVLCLFAYPAVAQIKAEDLWKSWQTQSTEMGYELKAGDVTRSGDSLIAKDVSFNMNAEDVKITTTLGEMVLRETGGAVEVTTSPEWQSETSVKTDDTTQTIRTTFSQSGYLMTVSGTAEQPSYKMKADSISFAQKMPLKEEGSKTEGSVNTSGTLNNMAGDFSLSGTAPQELAYNFTADSMKMVMKADGTDAGARSNFSLDVEKIASDFKGTMPPKAAAATEMTELLKIGLHGTANNSTGPVRFAVEVTSPDMPFKGEGGFSSTSSHFGLTGAEMKLDFDLNGIQAGPAGDKPAVSDLILRGLAQLEPTATDDSEAFRSGKLSITINESQALLDTLTASGLIPQDQLMGVQMMLAMFSKPGEKPGSITSTLELTETGDFLVNGQSMQ